MKFKTIALLGCMAAFFTSFAVFVHSDHNQALLLHRFELFNYTFTVVETLATVMVGAAFATGLYFSTRMVDLLRDERQFDRIRVEDRPDQDIQRAADFVIHGLPGRALEALADKVEPRSCYWRGRALQALGRNSEAALALKLAGFERADAGYLLADVLAAEGQSPEDALRQLIDSYPGEALNAYLLCLELLERQRRWEACLELAQQMERNGLPVPLGRILAYRYEGALLHGAADAKIMVERLQQILKDAPDFVPANLALGEAYMRMDAVEKAFRVYEQAFEKTGNAVFLDRLEDYYLDQGSPEDVIEVYRLLLSQKPNPTIQFKLGKLFFKLDMLDESREALSPLLPAFSRNAKFLWLMAEIEARSEHTVTSLDYLRDLVALTYDPNRDYQCAHCARAHASWQARCHDCGVWGLIRQQEDVR